MNPVFWLAAITALLTFITCLLRILATPRHRDQLAEWAQAAGSWLRRPPVLQPHTGRHTAAAFTVTLDAILQGRQPLAIEAPKEHGHATTAPAGRRASAPGSNPVRSEHRPPSDLPLLDVRPDLAGHQQPDNDWLTGEPTPAERLAARQAHGYIPALDPDHISLDDTVRLTRVQQYQDEAWWQAGENGRAGNWTPQPRHALALPAGRAS